MEHDGIVIDVEDERGLLTLDPENRKAARAFLLEKIRQELWKTYAARLNLQIQGRHVKEQTDAWTCKNFRVMQQEEIDEFLTLRVLDRPDAKGLYSAVGRVDIPCTTTHYSTSGYHQQDDVYPVTFQIACRLRRTCSPEE